MSFSLFKFAQLILPYPHYAKVFCFLCGNSAVKRKIVKRNERRLSVSAQNVFAFTLRTDDRETCRRVLRNTFQRDQIGFVFRFPADCERDILCSAVRVGAIKRRKSKTIFCDSVFQFLSMPSAINAYDMSLSLRPGSAIHLR